MSEFNQITTSYPLDMETDPDFPYLPPCMRCQPIIDYTTLRFHSNVIAYPIKVFSDEEPEYKFGVLDIKIRSEIPINKNHIHMFFTIDTSGSMSDVCQDGRTKMSHILHTLENMLRIFHENRECNISVHVQAFDTVIKTVISNVPNIHDANIEELIVLINQKIKPCGSTNIELALQEANTTIASYYTANPNHEIIHIFLTDGDITTGSRDQTHLLELVPKNCINVFIGYGLDHDSELLSHLSTEKGNEYRFVDALEKAGLVYGEVIHSILYKAIADVTLVANGAELYDYQKNTWTTDLQIGNLLSEQTKTYHVRTKNVDDCYISINGKTVIKTRQFQSINIYEKQTDVTPLQYFTNDLGIYMFRQRTQELLYESRQISQKYKSMYAYQPLRSLDDYERVDQAVETLHQQQKEIKEKLKEFHKTMLNYMKDKNLKNDPMMKMLCDDIYIAYKTTGTSIGAMYTCARQTSNGRQQTYMCSATHTQDLFDNTYQRPVGTLRLQRQTNAPTIGFTETTQVFHFDDGLIPPLDQDDIDNYAPTQDFLSPFSSDGVVTLMREVSGMHTIGNTILDEDEEEAEEN